MICTEALRIQEALYDNSYLISLSRKHRDLLITFIVHIN